MRNLIKGALLTILLTQICTAQWIWQNPLPQGHTIYSTKFISQTVGWAVGDAGTILRTTNGGTTWTQQSSGTTKLLWCVSFTNSNNGTVVGSYGTILRTTNGGNNWTRQSSGTTNVLLGVSFTDSNNGTAIGYSGIILRTTNSGSTWTQQSSGTTNYLYGVSFTDSNNGTAVGWGGIILRTTNGGVTFVKEDNYSSIPKEFILYQNYPNPFNPTTKISWWAPVSSWQTLKIYDVLGREIATLVNEYKPSGKYEIEFISSNLPSGIYFYRLQEGTLAQTKKMILL